MATLASFQGTATSLDRYEFSRPAMGTEFRIVLYASEASAAASAADAAFLRIAELDRTLSDYDPDSELSRLSSSAGTGRWVPVSQDLWDVISVAQAWSARTSGAFDITVGPLTRLWRWANRRGQPMPKDRAALLRRSVGYEKLELDPERRAVRLTVEGMRLDAGGIGKGYAADAAMAVLTERGFTQALVDAGGDLRIGDAPPLRSGWDVAVPGLNIGQGPTNDHVSMRNTAMATSGDIFRHTDTDEGERLSHILDPRLGRGVTSRRIVTVQAPSAAVADLLASAASVMSLAELDELMESEARAHVMRIIQPSETGDTWDLRVIKPMGANR